MDQPTQTPTDIPLGPPMPNHLNDSEEARKVLPTDELQNALGEIGVAAAHDLPNVGDTAILRFKNGTERPLTVNGYTNGQAQVTFPSVDGPGQPSNIDLGAFEELTRETRSKSS